MSFSRNLRYVDQLAIILVKKFKSLKLLVRIILKERLGEKRPLYFLIGTEGVIIELELIKLVNSLYIIIIRINSRNLS